MIFRRLSHVVLVLLVLVFLSVMMPCSIGVYEKSDGKTYISTMNAGLLGRMFGGVVAEVMAGSVARDTQSFVELNP